MYEPKSDEERRFLETYDSSKFEKPSVTVDVVIFVNDNNSQESTAKILLIKRKNYPYKDCWAIPGGFVEMNESLEEAAVRELEEETHVKGLPLAQFRTYGEIDRDPRMRVISVVYISFVDDARQLAFNADDDAKDARLFEIQLSGSKLSFIDNDNNLVLAEDDLAFDHAQIIRDSIISVTMSSTSK